MSAAVSPRRQVRPLEDRGPHRVVAQRACFAVAKEILAHKGLSDASYAAAEKTMGPEHLVALVAVIGAFSMTCITAGTFQIDPPANDPVPLAG